MTGSLTRLLNIYCLTNIFLGHENHKKQGLCLSEKSDSTLQPEANCFHRRVDQANHIFWKTWTRWWTWLGCLWLNWRAVPRLNLPWALSTTRAHLPLNFFVARLDFVFSCAGKWVVDLLLSSTPLSILGANNLLFQYRMSTHSSIRAPWCVF